MRYRIEQIKLKPGQKAEDLEQAIRKKLRRRDLAITGLTIRRESIDARKKPDVRLVYTVDFDCEEKLDLPEAVVQEYKAPFEDRDLEAFRSATGARPVIAGYGPAGIFAALLLAEWGLAPIIVERGEQVDDRVKAVETFWTKGILDPESNVQFGEGGAGTFSDGKLTTGVKDVRIRRVLEEFVAAGADPAILYKNKPHIGTDKLRQIVKNLRQKTEILGGTFLFRTRLEDVILDEAGSLKAVQLYDNRTGDSRTLETDSLILATGHSAADTFRMLYERGARMEQKPFSIGVRIEHPQEVIDRAQYGDPQLAEILGPADYKLHYKCRGGRGVYTFCMCPGGRVINSASEAGTVVTNGMSNAARDSGTANSGLLVDVRTDDFDSKHPLAGIKFQRTYEQKAFEAAAGKGQMPHTTYGAFRENAEDIVRSCLPAFAQDALLEAMPYLGRRLQGFDADSSVLTGVETRSSSPVRIQRDESGSCSIRGIMPAGEGPGYAGGIMSAAVDGMKAAEKLALQRRDRIKNTYHDQKKGESI